MNRKWIALTAGIVGIALFGHFSGNAKTGPTVTGAEIEEKQLQGKTVTIIGKARGLTETGARCTSTLLLQDNNYETIKVLMMPGSAPPKIITGLTYKIVGTALSRDVVSCTWAKSIVVQSEYWLSHTAKLHSYKGKFAGTNFYLKDVPDGWHHVKVFENEKGQKYIEVVD